MDRHTRHAELTLDQIPLETAEWDEINAFTHTFDGYTESGHSSAAPRLRTSGGTTA